jgi:hypothetical protein
MPSSSQEEFFEKYRDELITLLHKSQDAFEKQLSYISAGSLALSIGFIKDVVTNISAANCKWLLVGGWILLGITLLLNCISHIRAADLHSRTIDEINHKRYDEKRISKRYKEVGYLNWVTVGTMVFGIIAIIIFVSINVYYE